MIVVHGALRDSDRYLASARHAARLAASDALIVAPQFLAEVDRADGALYWRVEGWKGGYPALGPAPLSSFSVMDSLLARLAPEPGPDPAVVVFGNSAGGQFVNRYAAVGRGPDVLAVFAGSRVSRERSCWRRTSPPPRPARPRPPRRRGPGAAR